MELCAGMQSADKNILHNNKESVREREGVRVGASHLHGHKMLQQWGKQQNRKCWPGNAERMSASAARPTARTSVCRCYTHTHQVVTHPHTHTHTRNREAALDARKCIGARCERASQAKTNDANTFSLPSASRAKLRKAKRKITKNFSWHTGNFYLPAATFATPGRRASPTGEAVAVGS